MRNIIGWITIAVLLLLPLFVFTANAESPFELPRATLLVLTSFIALLVYLFQVSKEATLNFKFSTPLFILLGTLLSSIASYFFSINPHLSFWGSKLLPSDSVWTLIGTFTLTFVVFQFYFDSKKFKNLIYCLITVLAIQVAFGFAQLLKIDPFWWAESKVIFGTIGLTIAYATLVAALIPFAIYLFFESQSKRNSLLYALLILTSNFIILHSGSRTPVFVNWLSLFAMVIFYLVKTPNKKQAFLKSAQVLVLILTAFVLFKADPTKKELETKSTAQYLSHSIGVRLQLTLNAIEAWKEKPLLGHGPETYIITQLKYQTSEMNRSFWKNGWAKAHNAVAHYLATVGLIGTAFLVGLFLYVSYHCIRMLFSNKELSTENYLAYAVGCSFSVMFVSNLTCFNLVYTQLLYFLMPVWFGVLINSPIRTFNISSKPVIKFVFIMSFSVIYLIFTINSGKYWYTDVLFQNSRKAREFDQNNDLALDLLNQATELFEDDPYLYCTSALTINDVIIRNKKDLTKAIIQKPLAEIYKNTDLCVEKAINREHPIHLAAKAHFVLFAENIDANPTKVIDYFTLLTKLAPKNPEFYFRLGMVYKKLNNIELYESFIKKSIEVKMDYLPAHIQLLDYYYSQNQQEKAREIVQLALNIKFVSNEFVPEITKLVNVSKHYKDTDSYNSLTEFYKSNEHLIE
jgi:O-antigen ligase